MNWGMRHSVTVIIVFLAQGEHGPVADLFALLIRTFVAAAISVGAVVVLIVWQAPAGPEGAMLDVVVRVCRPMLWLVLAAALLVVRYPWSYGPSDACADAPESARQSKPSMLVLNHSSCYHFRVLDPRADAARISQRVKV